METDLKNHISLTSFNEMQDICRPLLKYFNIVGMEFARVYPNGSRAELSTHAQYLSDTYVTNQYFNQVYTPDLLPSNAGYVLPSQWVEAQSDKVKDKLRMQMNHEHEKFNFNSALCIVKKYEKFCDYYLFFSPVVNSEAVVHTYICNMDLLEKFILYFRDRAHDLILQAVKKPLVPPWRGYDIEADKMAINRNDFLNETQIKRYYSTIDPDVYLTPKEAMCIYYMTRGLGAPEIAKLMHTSKRTAEAHVNNIKAKFQCTNKSELIKSLDRHGLDQIKNMELLIV